MIEIRVAQERRLRGSGLAQKSAVLAIGDLAGS
jgi:hypothetical protein